MGEPSKKSIFPLKPSIALSTSLCCFGLALAAILPSSKLSWQLGYQHQLVLIGALFSIQTLCLQKVLPSSPILLEARLGKSRLQNYSAILGNDFLGSHINSTWRLVLFIFAILPIVMGIAYKQFPGGTSSHVISNPIKAQDRQYGLAFPDLGQYSSLSNSIYLSMNANAAFLNASKSELYYPNSQVFPLAFGYNTLVLNQDLAAMLDIPQATYITQIQGHLAKNEVWEVSADVNAFTAVRNHTIDTLRHDPDFLNQTLSKAYNGFASQYLYQAGSSLGFGWMSIGRSDVEDTYCLMGDVPGFLAPSSYPISFSRSPSDEGFLGFMELAQMFSIRRQACRAKWQITHSEVTLLEGSCTDPDSNYSKLLHDNQTSPYALDVFPVLVNTIAPYSTVRPNSDWKQVSYVVAAVNSWWARSAFLNYGTPDKDWIATKYPEMLYAPQNETIVSKKPTFRSVWGLYVVLGINPLVILIAYVSSRLCYRLPIDGNFGLASILAGIDRRTLHWVQGAGLSGEINQPTGLYVSIQQREEGNPRIRYVLSREVGQKPRGRIERNQEYY